jgi:hypothetical protein
VRVSSESRIFLALSVLVLSLFWLLYNPRLLGMLVFLGVLSSFYRSVRAKSWRSFVRSWILFFVCTLLPVDVSFRVARGLPRFVPVAYGLPSREGVEAAERGEVILGGCVVSGNEPRWVLVW